MKQKIDKKQYLRYMKTFVWASKKTMDELLQINKKGVLENYPVDANTVEDAINFVETGDGLRTTDISITLKMKRMRCGQLLDTCFLGY